jgi:hypothetical protein
MPLNRAVKRDDPFAKRSDFCAAATPARKGRNDLAFEHAVQGIGHEPAFPVGKLHGTACADDRALAPNPFDQRHFLRSKRAAVSEIDLNRHTCRALISILHRSALASLIGGAARLRKWSRHGEECSSPLFTVMPGRARAPSHGEG